jgi:hypothetical protein
MVRNVSSIDCFAYIPAQTNDKALVFFQEMRRDKHYKNCRNQFPFIRIDDFFRIRNEKKYIRVLLFTQ